MGKKQKLSKINKKASDECMDNLALNEGIFENNRLMAIFPAKLFLII